MRPPLSPAIAGASAYAVPRHPAPVRFRLDSGEGMLPPGRLLERLADADADRLIRQYPERHELEAQIAAFLDVHPSQVLVTAGADDALDRACRAFLAPGRNAIFPAPSFEMIARYIRWTGAELREVPWPYGPWPTEAVHAACNASTTLIAMVSPNNPTGAVATADDLVRISEAHPGAAILLDHAYVEFADDDLTAVALGLDNVLVFRTLSKAWGLAGLRVGWVAGPAWMITALRAAGNPYTVSAPSLMLAAYRLEHGRAEAASFAERVCVERQELENLLAIHDLAVQPSQGNFVFFRTGWSAWLKDALAGLGIAIRTWPNRPDLADAVRITMPGNEVAFDALVHGIKAALTPDAVIFDMDGVLVDTSRSYRAAIAATAAQFGVYLTQDDIREAKAEGHANNDWVLTRRLIERAGVRVTLANVTESFERLYQGVDGVPGLKRTEHALVDRPWLEALRKRFKLGIVTGRPRRDAMDFLEREGLTDLFDTIQCMEDGPLKPDPAPVRAAMDRLGVTRAWMIGDTVDDVVAAREAGVVPLGVVAPGDALDRASTELLRAGAARVLPNTTALAELLP
jgi:histidinol-phosphate aminotransferase